MAKTATEPRRPLRKENPDPVDVLAGLRLRLRRSFLGMSQDQLGKASGLTFQQIQKYERGINRMGASRLHQLAKILDISVSYFFDEAPDEAAWSVQGGFAEDGPKPPEGMPCADTTPTMPCPYETLALLQAYYRLKDPAKRHAALEMVRSLSRSAGDSAVDDVSPFKMPRQTSET